jgi:hypothetical protein
MHFPFAAGKAVAFFPPVKTPDAPHAFLPRLGEPPAPEEKGEKILPRYVQAPALRQHGFGPRNLFWGVVALVIALGLLGVALVIVGAKAIVFLATCLLTFTALFVLARLHIFRQRNGGFFALALVCMLGAALPLMEAAFDATRKFVAQRIPAGTPAPVVAASAPSAPGASREVPWLMESFALSQPEGPGKQVKVNKDSTVFIREKPFLVKAGDVFPFIESSLGETTFAARDLQLALPSVAVEVIDPQAIAKGVAGSAPIEPPAGKGESFQPTAAELAAITKSAQAEAARRYPALAIKDSFENAAFVSTYKQLKDAGSTEFFENPEWPLELAELLAKREGWARGAAPKTTGPDSEPVPDRSIDQPIEALPLDDGVPRGLR